MIVKLQGYVSTEVYIILGWCVFVGVIYLCFYVKNKYVK